MRRAGHGTEHSFGRQGMAYQRAGGQTLGTPSTTGASSIINATADIGDGQNSAPSSSRSQVAGAIGIVHRF